MTGTVMALVNAAHAFLVFSETKGMPKIWFYYRVGRVGRALWSNSLEEEMGAEGGVTSHRQ